ncbi:hypothetical protein [Nocardia sp. NPDC050793]|uniref:hypothetical protein n=1 Tax=Nocardia sp. NPDC050793 TaxID=3155159 RepID=UPI0034066917
MRRTVVGAAHTGWRIAGHRIEILFLQDACDATPAYRRGPAGKSVPIPLGQCGFVLFDERALPDLAQARDWFPRHHRLWDAVRAEFWAMSLWAGGARNAETSSPHRAKRR